MTDRNFKFYKDLPKLRERKWLDVLVIIPTLFTYSTNTYEYGKKYMFTRHIEFRFLWFAFGIQWEVGKKKD